MFCTLLVIAIHVFKGLASLPEHIQHNRNMKANEVQVADGNLLMKKINASVGQSMERKDEDCRR